MDVFIIAITIISSLIIIIIIFIMNIIIISIYRKKNIYISHFSMAKQSRFPYHVILVLLYKHLAGHSLYQSSKQCACCACLEFLNHVSPERGGEPVL